MVKSLTLYGLPGEVSVQDLQLIGASVLGVTRELTGFENAATADLVLRPFTFDSSAGRVTFEVPFSGGGGGRINRLYLERVFVLYKTLI